jgi:hypothetical protein
MSWAVSIDEHDEGLAGLRAADRDRPDQRVTRIDRGIAWHELLARFDEPSGIGDREANGITRGDRQDRSEIARQVTVQISPIEAQRVDQVRSATS